MTQSPFDAKDPWSRVMGFGVLVAFAVYIYSYWHQVHRLETLCRALTPGMSLVAVKTLVGDAGFAAEDQDSHKLTVPAPMTMGGRSCEISHDGKRVLSTGVR